ncbi:MAG TPA: nucleotidyltransferase family protein [Candidatus Rubrimentiphilum sp.]|nr:nucleotidyltransferase family protein [Candidatus Rubrimentiphilum sp.]
MNGVITAGARVDGEFARRIGTDVKALARIGGRTMLQAAIESARAAGVTRLAVIGGPEVRAACAGSADRFIEEGDGETNIRRALEAWESDAPLLYLTSDMPFIHAQALLAFLEAVPPDALALPLTSCAVFERRFPGAPPFGVAIGGERVVNGGAFWIPPNAAATVASFAVRFFSARKSVMRMAVLLGPVFCVRFMLRRLSIAALEQHAHHVLGIPARAIRDAPPDLAYDVDTLEEYDYAAEHA